MNDIPLDSPTGNSKPKITINDDDKAISQLIEKFNDEYIVSDDDEFKDNDERAYDAIFGGRRDIDRSSLHSASTKRRSNLSSLEVNQRGEQDKGGSFHAKVQETLVRLRQNKYIVFAMLVIITITYLSSNISKNKELLNERDESDESKYWNKKKIYNDKKVNDEMFNDGMDDGVGFDSFHDGTNEDAEEDQNYDALFGQHDEGENIYSTSSGGFTYYGADEESAEDTQSVVNANDNLDYKNEETVVEESSAFEDDPDHGIDMYEFESRFSDIDEPFQSHTETPFLFYIARTGAALEEELLLKCHGLVAASGRGDLEIDYGNEGLEVITTEDNQKYVNVDLRNSEGVERAISLNLAGSNMAELVVAQRITLASEIFHTPFKGKCFALIRHPIERAQSVFYALKKSPWEHSFKEEFVDMTLEDYAFSPYLESNWLTRMLTNKMEGKIDVSDLDDAKAFLSKKCLIGLTEEFDESHERFLKYFGWESSTDPICEDEVKLENEMDANQDRHRKLAKLTQKVYDRISDMNELDIKLYEYSLELFEEQKTLLAFQ